MLLKAITITDGQFGELNLIPEDGGVFKYNLASQDLWREVISPALERVTSMMPGIGFKLVEGQKKYMPFPEFSVDALTDGYPWEQHDHTLFKGVNMSESFTFFNVHEQDGEIIIKAHPMAFAALTLFLARATTVELKRV